LRFGLYLGTQQAVGADIRASLAEDIALARLLDETGWDSVWKGQHFVLETATGCQPAPLLARLAGEVEHLTLGVGVLLLALHNPVEVAETFATVDALCPAGFVLGVGVGYRRQEYDAFGVDPRRRGVRFERHLAALRSLWTDDVVDLDLPGCRVVAARNTARPPRPPPLWVGGATPRAVARAGRLGDAWMIGARTARPDAIALAATAAEARRAGGLPEATARPLVREVLCAADRDTAVAMGAAVAGVDLGADPFAALLQRGFIVGSATDCFEQLVPWVDDLRVDHFIFRCQWAAVEPRAALSSIRRMTEEVLPSLRAHVAGQAT
jgi:alkanesulfonate monooxygenase SsuD/methylene tetrahydromethanopterin reductase-like flavin-dependent oxidoreductase (luciferase family)